MSVQVSYKKQFLLGFIIIILLLTTLEVVLRVYDFSFPSCNVFHSEVSQDLDADLRRSICHDSSKLIWNDVPLRLIPSQHHTTININSDGFRGEELDHITDYRIFVIGGSSTFGSGSSSDSKTIPAFLQKKIDTDFAEYNIQVINAGIPKAFSSSEIDLIQDVILSYSPNLLIIYDGWNDITHNYEDFYSNEEKPTDQIIRQINRSDYQTPKILLQHYFNYKHTTGIMEFDSSNIEEKALVWKERLEGACQSAKQDNYKMIVMLQPLLGSGNKSLTIEEEKSFNHYDSGTVNVFYELFANKLNELDKSCDLVVDLRNAIDSYEQTVYFDSGHMGDFGNEIVGNEMYKNIFPIIHEDLES